MAVGVRTGWASVFPILACWPIQFEQVVRYVGIGQCEVKNPIKCNANGFAVVILSVWVLIVELIAHRFNLGMLPDHEILFLSELIFVAVPLRQTKSAPGLPDSMPMVDARIL